MARLKDGDMRVSVFVDPEPDSASLAREVGADRIEIFTGPYGAAWAFVASRYVHTWLHLTSNVVQQRFAAFVIGLGLLVAMWVVLGVQLAS